MLPPPDGSVSAAAVPPPTTHTVNLNSWSLLAQNSDTMKDERSLSVVSLVVIRCAHGHHPLCPGSSSVVPKVIIHCVHGRHPFCLWSSSVVTDAHPHPGPGREERGPICARKPAWKLKDNAAGRWIKLNNCHFHHSCIPFHSISSISQHVPQKKVGEVPLT